MSLIPVYCDLCGEHIANAERKELSLPLRGVMFQPRESGFPDPFPKEATWEFMRCPFGSHRPFIEEQLIQVGPLTPGNKPVLDLSQPFKPERVERDAVSHQPMFSLSGPEWQGEPQEEQATVQMQPLPQSKKGRGKRDGKRK